MTDRKKVAIITNGAFPVPAVRGGAVEALVEMILKENEIYHELDITLFSIYDEMALKAGVSYPSVHFEFIRPSDSLLKLDSLIHHFAYDSLKLQNHLSFKTIFQRVSYLIQTAEIINERDFDSLIFENQMASLWILKYKNNYEKYAGKYYFHLHNHPERYSNAEELAGSANKVICVSSFIGKAFAHNIGVPYTSDKFAVLKNVVDESLFDPSTVTREDVVWVKDQLKIHDKKTVLFLGRLMEGKGVRELLQAFEIINRQDTLLVIVGSFNFGNSEKSPYEEELNGLIQRIGQDRVIFTGYINHDDVPKYYAAADIVCMPSTCEDAAPLAVIECLRMEKPLITTTMGGIPEYADESCAIMLDNDEHLIDRLACSMNKLLDDPDECQRLSSGAGKISEDRTLASYYHNLVSILENS